MSFSSPATCWVFATSAASSASARQTATPEVFSWIAPTPETHFHEEPAPQTTLNLFPGTEYVATYQGTATRDLNGEASIYTPIPFGWGGITIWFRALDSGSMVLANEVPPCLSEFIAAQPALGERRPKMNGGRGCVPEGRGGLRG